MKAYMIQSAKRIEPFGEHPRDCLVANRRLGELQEEALRRQGLELQVVQDPSLVDDPEEHLVFDDALCFTPELLQDFIGRSRRLGSRTVCALKPGIFTLRTVIATQDVRTYPDRVEYGLHYLPTGPQRGASQPVVIDPDQFMESLTMPEHMFGGREYWIPMTDRVLCSVDHWVTLWSANICALLTEGARLKNGPRARLLALALKAQSFNQWKVLRQANRIGRNCDIHPAAYVEGSTIGDNVRIGAGSVIRESMVGDGSFIGNNVTLELSVLGERCTIINGCTVEFCVLNPGTFVNSRFMNVSICGRNTFVGDGVVFTDFRFDKRSVTVLKDGVPLDTENTFIGGCLGHGVYLGSGCVLAAGRSIPNGWRILAEPERVISSCQPGRVVPGYRVMEAADQQVDHCSESGSRPNSGMEG